MSSRARAASLCVVALSVLALLPAAAVAQMTPIQPGEGATMHQWAWPGTVASGSNVVASPEAAVAEIVSPGSCNLSPGETRTYTFSYADQGVILRADGSFEEHGSFTIANHGDGLVVTDFDSTFSGSSPAGSVVGERHTREDEAPNASISCGGTSDADRMLLTGFLVPTEHRLTSASTGAVVVERGFAHVSLASVSQSGFGHYVAMFFSDEDGDLISLDYDNCPDVADWFQTDSDGDGAGDVCDADDDGDSRADDSDNCPFVPNADQADADRDGIGDECDPETDVQDTDGDEVIDAADNCVDVANADQADTGGTALGDACEDRDADGVGDLVDNCADDANPNQANLDGDPAGDACDPDDDGDAVADGSDNCPVVANPTQRDSDFDGAGDLCDGVFDSNDGFAGGGGKLAGNVHLSVALHSRAGSIHGSGHLADGSTTVRLLDATGLRSDGDRAVAVGSARVDDGQPVPYRLEITDAANTFELEIGDRRWAGTLTNGNLVVK